MVTISACLIVKNEESCIKECLDSISPLCDEIIIFDTGSTDRTKEIATKNPLVKFIEGSWQNDFAWARNQSFSYATMDYILWVDADDLIDSFSMDFLLNLKKNDLEKYDMIIMPYRYHFDGKNDLYTLDRERLIKRSLNLKWKGRIHECLPIVGNYFQLNNKQAYIIHNHQKPYTDRNLKIFQDMEKNNQIIDVRDQFYYANELFTNKLYDDALKWYLKCINNNNIWRIDKLNAYLKLYKLYRFIYNNIDEAFKYATLAITCTDTPRSDVCCALGDIYMQKNNIDWSILWYEKAYNNIVSGFESVFLETHTYTITPLLQLCVLYFKKGDIKKSFEIHKICKDIDPNNESVIHNTKYFSSIGLF